MLLSCLLALSVLQNKLPGDSRLPSRIRPEKPEATQLLATVDGVRVTVGDVEPMVWQIFHRAIAREYVNYLTVEHAADAAKVSASEDEVNARMQQAFDQIKRSLPAGQTIDEALLAHQYSEARLYLSVKTRLLLERIQLKNFDPRDWAHVSMISFPTPDGKADIDKQAIDKAKDFYDKVKSGGNWDQLVSQSTSDPTIVRTKGDLGWRPVSDLPPVTQALLKDARSGDVLPPIQIPGAVEVFKLDTLGQVATGPEADALKAIYLRSSIGQTIKAISEKSKVTWAKGE